MTYLYWTLAVLLGAPYLLWGHFLACTNLYEAKRTGTLPQAAFGLGVPILAIGGLLDVFTQITVASLLFVEPPREWTVSQRVARHVEHGSGWRLGVALWLRINLLKPFDRSGGHG